MDKYYIDFEANLDKEIISVGVVSADGERSFSSLVKPHHKLDHKIKELTGITQEQADAAPEFAEVTMRLFEFLYQYPILSSRHHSLCEFMVTPIEIITYSNNDRKFVERTLEMSDTTSFTELFWRYLAANMVDKSKQIASCFNRDSISLQSAYLTMKAEEAQPQTHDPLEDARMLRYCDLRSEDYHISDGESVVKVPRPKMQYGKGKSPAFLVPVRCYKVLGNGETKVTEYPTVYAALCCAPQNAIKQNKGQTLRRILEAAEARKKYAGRTWELITDNSDLH